MTVSTTSSALPIKLGIIVLGLVTAIVHLYLGFQGLPLFVLNGIGYLALLALLYLPIPRLASYRDQIRWVLIGYTALTMILWLVITGGQSTVTGYTDKVVELLLIILLLAEARQSSR